MTQSWGQYQGEIKGFRFQDVNNQPTNLTGKQEPKEMPYHPPAEREFIEAMRGIASRYGKLADNDENGIWIGYEKKKDNDAYSIGVYCSNCAHYESENVCKIVKTQIEPGGKCRLAAIPFSSIKINKKN